MNKVSLPPPLPQSPPLPPSLPIKKGKKSNKGLIIGSIITVVLILLLFLGIKLYITEKERQEQERIAFLEEERRQLEKKENDRKEEERRQQRLREERDERYRIAREEELKQQQAIFTVDGVSFEMVFVQGGTFTMGCTIEQGSDCFDEEKPAHQVTVNSFNIGKYAITQAQWKALMGNNNPSGFKGDNLPVENVNWYDVQEFIRKLNAHTGKNYRLPTEAEWEYAARGGNKGGGYKYSGSNNINDVVWYISNNGNKTQPVGTKRPNELGIYDMSGNVLEWCNDWYEDYSGLSRTNPQGPPSGTNRVLRGGGWSSGAQHSRISIRYQRTPDFRFNNIGFRLAI